MPRSSSNTLLEAPSLDVHEALCSNELVRRGKFLALDYGAKNVGLACCDELAVTVRPLPSIPNVGKRGLISRLRSLARENEVEELVIGIPWNMDGTAGEAAERAEAIARALRSELGLPVRGVDERLSTLEAMEAWSQMTARRRRKYRTIDSLAATLILQRFLRDE